MWSAGVQREIPLNFILDVTYVGRRGLYLQREREINQALAGTIQANPGVKAEALRPYKGYSQIRLSENAGYSKYKSLQISAERRYKNGFKFSAAYTYGHSEDNASSKRDVLFYAYDDSGFWGNSSFDRRQCSHSGTSTICRSTATRQASLARRSVAGRLRDRRSCERERRCG